eukprot:TRINITY_DN111710_c0_g1_i1.p1 TRINITY_DN111710_c0_g1~~TRINITY_DN111710_c0_g1_i1.p1  ORF type:complete len:172 (-),score=33.58 TRINITY_DN111710_c0_g1_i1:43-558(-)
MADLRDLWAGGRDCWPELPSGECIYTRPAVGSEAPSEWPEIVQESILFGLGAYNPRGKEQAEDVNKAQHQQLDTRLEEGLKSIGCGIRWASSSVFEGGLEEPGFIVAFQKRSDTELIKGRALVIELATAFEQGAIYEFALKDGRLMRSTVPVLNPDTEADVEVVRDDRLIR